MAYKLPDFNITVEYRHRTGPSTWGPWIETVAQLKGVASPRDLAAVSSMLAASQALILKLPSNTDIRDSGSLASNDQVRIPLWTGDPLSVAAVYDVAYGFPNEYRVAVLARTNLNGSVIARPPGQGAIA